MNRNAGSIAAAEKLRQDALYLCIANRCRRLRSAATTPNVPTPSSHAPGSGTIVTPANPPISPERFPGPDSVNVFNTAPVTRSIS